MTSTKEPVKNVDLWKRLDQLVTQHHVTWKWVKGHAGHADNERCDGLAGREIAKLKQQHTKAERQAALEAFKNPNATVAALYESRADEAVKAKLGSHRPSLKNRTEPAQTHGSPSIPIETRTLKQASLF